MEDTPSLVTLSIHLKETLCCPSRTSTLLGDWPSTHLAAVSTWSADMRAPPHLENSLCINVHFILFCVLYQGVVSVVPGVTSATCHGYSFSSVSWPPIILFSLGPGLTSTTAALLGMPQLHFPPRPLPPFFATTSAVKETNKILNLQIFIVYYSD